MYKNYIFPIQIFLILEKMNINLYSSEKNYFNHYNIFLSNNWLLPFSMLIKNELTLNENFLLENSALDLKYYSNFNKYFNFFNLNFDKLIYYTFNINSLKLKISIFLLNKLYFKNYNIHSLDKIYPNASWIERETSEMYGIKFYNKKDCRKLMLDYSLNENPMLKDFPLEGNRQVFFSFFENQVITQTNKFIEI